MELTPVFRRSTHPLLGEVDLAKARPRGTATFCAWLGALWVPLAVLVGGVAAAPRSPAVTGSLPPAPARAGYFVDFRSRPGYLVGHTFVVYGRLDTAGRPADTRYAGSYPLDGQRGLIIGSFVPVPASVRGVEEDYRQPPSNIYRRRLSARQFARLERIVRRLRADEHWWNLLFANCNDFAIGVARRLGMRTPPSWLLPREFIAGLRALNGG
jgi:hypothetical protein